MESHDGRFPPSLQPGSNDIMQGVKLFSRELSFHQKAIKAVDGGKLNWSEKSSVSRNRERAAIESSALQLLCPRLSVIPFFPALYRLVRTEDLNGSFDRGGDTLLVGSGTTLYEALAMVVKPPTLDETREVLNGDNLNALPKIQRQVVSPGFPTAMPELIPHKITAVEPDVRQTKNFPETNSLFQLSVDLRNQVLSEFLEMSSESYNTILMNRVDPRGFDETPELIDQLLNRVKQGGSMMVTIGTGNNSTEFQERKKFLEFMKDKFAAHRFVVSSKLPTEYRDVNYQYFGHEIRGSVAARKK